MRFLHCVIIPVHFSNDEVISEDSVWSHAHTFASKLSCAITLASVIIFNICHLIWSSRSLVIFSTTLFTPSTHVILRYPQHVWVRSEDTRTPSGLPFWAAGYHLLLPPGWTLQGAALGSGAGTQCCCEHPNRKCGCPNCAKCLPLFNCIFCEARFSFLSDDWAALDLGHYPTILSFLCEFTYRLNSWISGFSHWMNEDNLWFLFIGISRLF